MIKVLLNINGKLTGDIIPPSEPWTSWARDKDTAFGGHLICEEVIQFNGLDDRIIEGLKAVGITDVEGLKNIVADKDAFLAINGLGERAFEKAQTWLTEKGEL